MTDVKTFARSHRYYHHNIRCAWTRDTVYKIYFSNSAASRLAFLIFALDPSELVREYQDQVLNIPDQKVQSLSWISVPPFGLHPRGVLE